MKLIKLNHHQVSDTKEVPGLLNCRLDYDIKSAQGRLDYTGPPFNPALWHPVLSFFRWTHEQMQSESQVRLYVNHRLGRWGAWAFPQKARTGMTARELPVLESVEQARVRFAFWDSEPSDDWLYFGTAHHHCSASAFQSSTDEQNEWNQDGLHLTVGRMDAEQHDVHARFYIGGNAFEPDLSRFWPVAPQLAAQLPVALHGEVARFQMGAKVSVEFPAAWKANLIEPKAESLSLLTDGSPARELDRMRPPLYIRLDETVEEIHHYCVAQSIEEGDWLAELSSLAERELTHVIIEACVRNGVTPEELLIELTEDVFSQHRDEDLPQPADSLR